VSHQPRKRFGQHFLHDPGIIERMVRTLAPGPGDRIVEIGPGTGALTAALLERVDHLDAVELDRDLIAELRQRWSPHQLTLHERDALKMDFAALAGDGPPLRLTGNLPYNISTPLIFHLLQTPTVIRDMHFMLQREVVDRLAAAPGDKQRGRLSVMVQYHCQVDALFTVPPGAFTPPPKVTSAVVRLVPLAERPHVANDDEVLTGLVRQAFSQRRKAIRNSLKSRLSAEHITAAGVDPGQRPEQLALADFVALANAQSRA
jgi:16S rRNA (adenine1518-N6/adenine1519-N6)-dimethyltransferase